MSTTPIGSRRGGRVGARRVAAGRRQGGTARVDIVGMILGIG